MREDLHVMTNIDGKWALRRSGASRATRLFPSKTAAVAAGKKAAKRNGVVLCIHHKDGRVARRVEPQRTVKRFKHRDPMFAAKVRAAVRKVLRDPRRSKKAKTARGEALAQRPVEQ